MRSSPPRSSHPRRSPLRTTATIIIALLVIVGLVAPAVLAHAQLLSSSPADGASLPTTDEVSLTFNEDIDPAFVEIVAEGADGDVTDGDPVVAGRVVTQPISPAASGPHTVTYRVVSRDGHPVSGSVSFTLTQVPAGTPSAGATGATTTEVPQTPAPATPVSNDEAVASASAADEDGAGTGTWLVVGALAAAVAAGVGLAWAAARSRRHPEH
jgi:methionine-rich copper-binding protein CopC